MAAGHARVMYAESGKRVQIVDRMGRVRWCDSWEGIPYIARPGEHGEFLQHRNAPKCRPYLDYARSTRERWAFVDHYRAIPAWLPAVKPDARGMGYTLIEPTLKADASPNKLWPGWSDLVATGARRWAQMCPPGVQALPGVHRIQTDTYRAAWSVMATADGMVLPEGGLHHAAAAFGLRAVVLFGAFMPVEITGYKMHINFAIDDPAGAGWRIPNAACAAAWKKIRVKDVLCALS